MQFYRKKTNKIWKKTLVEIPAYVNGKPVTTINADAFSSYNDLHSVRIPGTVETINFQSFTANNSAWYEPAERDTITIYHEGKSSDWNAAMTDYNNRVFNDNSLLQSGWDNMMGEGSRVFFLVDRNVDNTQYWELYKYLDRGYKYVWVHHEHPYSHTSKCTTCDRSGEVTNYLGGCTCNVDGCKGQPRPDAEYWK